MLKFIYDVVNKESRETIRKDAIQEIEEGDMTKEAAIEALKFFCCGANEEVANIRMEG